MVQEVKYVAGDRVEAIASLIWGIDRGDKGTVNHVSRDISDRDNFLHVIFDKKPGVVNGGWYDYHFRKLPSADIWVVGRNTYASEQGAEQVARKLGNNNPSETYYVAKVVGKVVSTVIPASVKIEYKKV